MEDRYAFLVGRPLRTRAPRPRRRAADSYDKLAALHVSPRRTTPAQYEIITVYSPRRVRNGVPIRCMSALGQKQTCAVQQPMSALLRIATGKADSRNRLCPLYPRMRARVGQLARQALGQ